MWFLDPTTVAVAVSKFENTRKALWRLPLSKCESDDYNEREDA
jgi:hypothetical protein